MLNIPIGHSNCDKLMTINSRNCRIATKQVHIQVMSLYCTGFFFLNTEVFRIQDNPEEYAIKLYKVDSSCYIFKMFLLLEMRIGENGWLYEC